MPQPQQPQNSGADGDYRGARTRLLRYVASRRRYEGYTSSERVGFLREGGSAGAEKVIYAFLSGSMRAGESGKLMVQRTT